MKLYINILCVLLCANLVFAQTNLSSASGGSSSKIRVLNNEIIADLRIVGNANHITEDAGIGNNGTDAGTGKDNIFIGKYSGGSIISGSENVGIGAGALQSIVTGHSNTAIGYQSLKSGGGTQNTAIGKQALYLNATNDNTAIGYHALFSNTTGSSNTAAGMGAMRFATDGKFNSAYGKYALANVSGGDNNSAVGYMALSKVNGDKNVAFGWMAGNGGSSLVTVSNNVLLGYYAGGFLKTGGDGNIIIGSQTGTNISTGANNCIIGYRINAPSATASNQLNIGNLIFSEGVDGLFSTISSGNIGIKTKTPNSTLHVEGSFSASIRNIADGGTVGDSDYTVLAQGNISLPTADATNIGRIYNIINDTLIDITISGTFRFSGANSTSLLMKFNKDELKAITVQSTGSAWVVISEH